MFGPETMVAMPSGLDTSSREELLALISRVGPWRLAVIAHGRFPRTALRTRRAPFSATGSPWFLKGMQIPGTMELGFYSLDSYTGLPRRWKRRDRRPHCRRVSSHDR